jgi:hypothetical protein
MNEKIKLLAEQADAYAHLTGEGMMYQKTRDRYTEKFAELIVRECAGILEPKSRYMGEGPEVLKDKIRQIKQHFGVEE